MGKELSDEERFQLDQPPQEEPIRDPTWQELTEGYIQGHSTQLKAIEERITDLEGRKEEKVVEELTAEVDKSTWHGRAQGFYQTLIDIKGTRGIEHLSARYTGRDPELVDYVKVFDEGKNWALNLLKGTITSRLHECGYEPGSHGPEKLVKEAADEQ